jgi:LmbE family N-acetylglucosaminyl deacetylase
VLVVATMGEHGEVADGVLAPGETLAERRVKETDASAAALGVHRVEFLGYADSGMVDTPENDAPGSFWTADVDEAADRLAAILTEESADVLTIYDDHGGYGHPDHVQVHRVGTRAATIAGTPKVFQATINRDAVLRFVKELPPAEREDGELAELENDPLLGTPEDQITCQVDVRDFLAQKRASMRAHASQIPHDHFMSAMPDTAFRRAFGIEWFIREGEGPGITETSVI